MQLLPYNYEYSNSAALYFKKPKVVETINTLLKLNPELRIIYRHINTRGLILINDVGPKIYGMEDDQVAKVAVKEALDAMKSYKPDPSNCDRYWREGIKHGSCYKNPKHMQEKTFLSPRAHCSFCYDPFDDSGHDPIVASRFASGRVHQSCENQLRRRNESEKSEGRKYQTIKPPVKEELPSDVGPWSADDALYEVTG